MNPHKEIVNLDRLLDGLTRSLDFSRNKQKDIDTINIITNARNCFEDMLTKQYFTDVIETMIYDKFLSIYRQYRIKDGGDINLAEKSIMILFKSMFALNSDSKKELVKEELGMYLDFHAEKDGTWSDDKTEKELKLYLKTRDEVIDVKLKERIKTIKSLIFYNKVKK